MKTLAIFFLFAVLSFFSPKSQSFSSVTLGNVKNHEAISFSLPHETNVSYYRVEASADGANYDIIGTVKSTGNSVFSKSYSYELYSSTYKYYRVAAVCMNARMQYSPVVTAQPQAPKVPGINRPEVTSDPVVASNLNK